MITLRKIGTCCAIGILALAAKTTTSEASEIPVTGINLVLNDLYHTSEDLTIDLGEYLSIPSEFKDISFANVANYVNIRSSADENSKILGKLYSKSAATILGTTGEWYQVKSGSVTGYIKGDYLFTGQEAQAMAETLVKKVAVVNTTSLRVRKQDSLNSSILTQAPEGEKLEVLEEQGEWVKVKFQGNTGFVSSEYVKVKMEFEEAISIEEEQRRLAAEQAAREAENAARAARQSQTIRSTSTTTSAPRSNASSSKRDKIVNDAYNYVGNPYVYGGTSLTNGADCSGFTQTLFKNHGVSIPRDSRSQAAGGKKVSLSNLKKGDLIFYTKSGRINHVALYIGNGKVISASSPKSGIKIANYNYRTPYKAVSYLD